MATRKILDNNLNDLIRNLGYYYKNSLDISKEFGGPSVYFHKECIKECRKNFLSNRHIELIYATLASWGMHRMGDTKTKLVDFKVFKESILNKKNDLLPLLKYKLEKIDNIQIENILDGKLKNIFLNLSVSISESKLVANSKTMHHILPNLIPPMDRQYTVRFFYYKKNIFFNKEGKYKIISLSKNDETQYKLFSDMFKKMHLLIKGNEFSKLKISFKTGGFNTSYTKIIDNLIMSYIKNTKNKKL